MLQDIFAEQYMTEMQKLCKQLSKQTVIYYYLFIYYGESYVLQENAGEGECYYAGMW